MPATLVGLSRPSPRPSPRSWGRFLATALAAWLLLGHTSFAADDDDDKDGDTMSQADKAESRFPQPVSIGALLQRTVLEPTESQPILGHVKAIVRSSDGSIKVVVTYGGFLGFGGRPIAVPVEAMVVLGEYMEIVDFTPDQLKGFPTFDPTGTKPFSRSDTIKVGLAKPSH